MFRIIEGDFKNNVIEGNGTYYCSNGNLYIGSFKNNKPEGKPRKKNSSRKFKLKAMAMSKKISVCTFGTNRKNLRVF